MIVIPDPTKSIEEQTSSVLERMLVYGEARDQSNAGKLAVLYVAHNRSVKLDIPISSAILIHNQFSCFNISDPNRSKLMTAHKDDPLTWIICHTVCNMFDLGLTKDPTYGSLNYYNPNISSPSWGKDKNPKWKQLAVIDNHIFGVA